MDNAIEAIRQRIDAGQTSTNDIIYMSIGGFIVYIPAGTGPIRRFKLEEL